MIFNTFNHNDFDIDKAIKFAHVAHSERFVLEDGTLGAQRRKYDGTPYIVHPMAVARLLWHFNMPKSTIIAAILHDTVEDTDVTNDEIRETFDPVVAGLVSWVSDPEKEDYPKTADGKVPNRAARKKFDRERLASAPVEAKNIKVSDLFDNTKSIVFNDINFARTYLDEKLALIQESLYDAHPALLQMAHDSCIASMKFIERFDELTTERDEALRYEKAIRSKVNEPIIGVDV